jgi:hypothetical protein
MVVGFFSKKKKQRFSFFLQGQIDLVSLMTLGCFFPLSKGSATSFKPIYKHHGQR